MTEQNSPLGRESRNLDEQRFSTQAPASGASNPSIRRGKWTAEEEAYALAALRDFNSGYLDAPPGTTLRAYLSENLRCDPMRITKKFTCDASIGKKVWYQIIIPHTHTLLNVPDTFCSCIFVHFSYPSNRYFVQRQSAILKL